MNMIQTILVPTDFSEASVNASEYAVKLAKEINAKVVLLHVYHVPVPVSPEVPVMAISPDELQKQNEDQLREAAVYLKGQSGVEVDYIARMGFAVDEILEEEKNVNLIVMGMKGAGRLSEVLMGSITTAAIRKVKTPVLVIPENTKYKKPEKIVFACDYDPRTNVHTIDTVKTLIKALGSRIYVLNVKKKEKSISVEEAATGVNLENELSDIDHVYYFSQKKDPVEGIGEFVEEKQADMVIVIPHHYNLVEGLFHKSISKKMAFHTHVPLLALPDNHKTVPTYLF
ncbi:MAG TPA: universal stress protein [Bacteroidia bacterium]|jgi:nucleotide-binding universal stress UspA family protein